MSVEDWPIGKPKPYHSNPRKNDAAIASVAKSIKTFGFRQPIVVDSDGIIIVGHTRYAAALLLKLETVPVHVATDMTPEEARAYRLADNRVGEIAEWDFDALRSEIGALQTTGFDLDGYGWSQDDFDKMLNGDDSSESGDEKEPADEVDLSPQYSVIVIVDSEEAQGEAFDRISALGYKCKCTML